MSAALSSSSSIRLLLADDHPVVRQGLALILDSEEDMAVVAQASNGQEAADLFRQHQPDVALLDLRMPLLNGVEATAAIRAEFPTACIILLTTYDGDEDIYQGLRAGAKSYLLKDTPCEEIIEAIRQVCQGRRHLSPHVGEKLAERMELPQLSGREREVLQLIAKGRNNLEIGQALNIAESTVKTHVNSILGKLRVSDRTQAAILALRRGLAKL
ncbi:response regulator transcription factor [Pseudanabaena sp. FACHB-2040]|uniref:response regulator n=1 Tax=Pseudanabaena sp. FACHB-2040 TaxID=2692859 RepID=UPI001682E7A8|nr:response regulator transcription factor [Pseudanabaena sp. FACHB-2040]MBD2256035.1 response regulator transcription factor [Pseudanabaena sp. FACHB-2040]